MCIWIEGTNIMKISASLGDEYRNTHILERFAYGQDIIWRPHHFLDQFRACRHHYPLAESGNLE
jgi:hypothetical protein